MFIFELKKKKKELERLYSKKHRLEDICEEKHTKEAEENVAKVLKEIDDFIENDFAKMVFEHYSRKKPSLVERYTNEKVEWVDAFGDKFDKVPKLLRHSLVGLVTDEGKYKF